MIDIDYTGYRAVLTNGQEVVERPVIGSTSWNDVPVNRVAVLELWWRGVRKVSIDFLKHRSDGQPYYSITGSFDASSPEKVKVLSRNVGIQFNDGFKQISSVNESTGEVFSANSRG